MMPAYEVQLNGYALIGNKVGFFPITSLLLCYYEPQANHLDENPEEIISVLKEEGFMMAFEAHILEVDLEPEKMVEPLLGEVRRLGDLEEAPEGAEGCEDCRRLGDLVSNIFGSVVGNHYFSNFSFSMGGPPPYFAVEPSAKVASYI